MLQIQQAGVRPLLQGLVLWMIVSASTLELIWFGWIHV